MAGIPVDSMWMFALRSPTLKATSRCVGGWVRRSRMGPVCRVPEPFAGRYERYRARASSSLDTYKSPRPLLPSFSFARHPLARFSSPGISYRTRRVAGRVYTSTPPSSSPCPVPVEVLISTESSDPMHSELESQLQQDAIRITQEAAWYVVKDRDDPSPPLELSILLCDDEHIRELNKDWRGMDKATDVLSFEMEDDDIGEMEGMIMGGEVEEDGVDAVVRGSGESRPPVILGDVVVSIDTAQRQADERGHSLVDECRILLVHGVLHLLGFDHEEDEDEAKEMEEAERWVLAALGWGGKHGDGLIGLSGVSSSPNLPNASQSSISPGSSSGSQPSKSDPVAPKTARDIRLLFLDMDGTLLDSTSNVLESSIEALKLAMERDVRVVLATGKARPAAMAAMEKAGLAGNDLVVGLNTPGIFLQGLQVYGKGGAALQSGALDMEVARRVLEFAMARDIAITCFLGDECVTPKVTEELEELHYRYYEPYPVQLTVDDILKGPPIRKMLMMNNDVGLMQAIRPDMDDQLRGTIAGTMVAVDTMLEVVPHGFNKGTALRALVADMESDGVRVENVMAIGDGANDLEMVMEAGIGVAMGNAVDIVKENADDIVASNDADGIYQAIMKHILS